MLRSDVAKTKDAESRRAPRQRAFLRAKISYLDGAISFDCVVTQISSTGAKINLAEGVTLPERFRVEIAGKNINRIARLVRREPDGAALSFVDETEAPDWTLTALNERLRVLEAENKMLRANCDKLAAQIQRANASY